MSERGSYVTEWMYCDACRAKVRSVLERVFGDDARVSLTGRIYAGYVKGLYAGEELHVFENEVMPLLDGVLCHPVRIAVLAENGERVFTVTPKESTDGEAQHRAT